MRFLFAMICCAVAGNAAAQQIDTLGMRAHTRFLSADSLEGRSAGSRGERSAGLYIESQLRQLGLSPIQGDSFRLPVPLQRAHIDRSTLTLERSGAAPFQHGRDFIWNTGGPRAFHDFGGPAVHLSAVADTSAANYAGRVVVLIGTLGSDAQWLVPLFLRLGVQGVISVIPDSAQYELIARSRGDSRFYTLDAEDPIWQPNLPMLVASPRLGRALLGNSFDSAPNQPPLEPLGFNLKVSVATTVASIPSANIGGVIRGADPTLADQYVLFTAHLDHLGIGTPGPNGDSIFNGFSDNAAGVAMLLAIAKAFKQEPPARSVAFLFLSAEERGLLGSAYLANRPPFPLDRVRGLVNLDAGAPPAPPLDWRLAGGENSPIGTLAQAIAAKHGWTVNLTAASPNSDHWPFLARGVPSVFLIPGDKWEGVTTAQHDALKLRWDRYHRLDDEWAPDFPFAGLQRYALFAYEIGKALASR